MKNTAIIREVTKHYGEQTVLDRFSAEIDDNTAIMGASGSGKTTLVRLILGLESPDHGEVVFTKKPKFSVVFQEDRLFEDFSAVENITAVIGVMKDKNYREVLAKTLPYCKKVICVKPNVPRALQVEELAIEARQYCSEVLAVENIGDVLLHLDQNPTFVFGSLYLASEICPLLRR